MGEVADTLTRKKKKGRPSLIKVQKRALKQQQLLQKKIDEPKRELRSGFKNPNSGSRFNRRRYNPNEDSEEADGDDEDEEDKRREKKHRLLHGLNSNDRLRSSSNLKSDGCDFDANASIRRRKIGGTGSDDNLEKASKATDILQGSLVESGPFTPLPDKKLLLFIVDRLQKKDTYGVYSDPVDPEELPDYHEIIENPMDFSTLRKKLESRAYATLEQFEQDVFLICKNAMEYNSADTVYYRQARAMLGIAKRDFQNLRQESDEEEEEEPVTTLSQQPSATQTLGGGGGDKSRLSGAYNLRKTPPYRFRQAETSDRINHHSENQIGFSIDWEKEFPPSVVKAVDKYGMKNVENRRDTYNHDSTSLQEASIFTTFDDDLKQLTPVGLRNEYGYAMSLARYAAKLGPVAWKFANKRTKISLPNGVEFGPGWVGENVEAPPPQQQKCSNDLASDDHLHSSIHSSAPGARLLNQESESNGDQNQMLETAVSRQGLLPNRKQEFNRFPPDLNVKLVSPNSPVSNHQAGSSQYPDLALQL